MLPTAPSPGAASGQGMMHLACTLTCWRRLKKADHDRVACSQLVRCPRRSVRSADGLDSLGAFDGATHVVAGCVMAVLGPGWSAWSGAATLVNTGRAEQVGADVPEPPGDPGGSGRTRRPSEVPQAFEGALPSVCSRGQPSDRAARGPARRYRGRRALTVFPPAWRVTAPACARWLTIGQPKPPVPPWRSGTRSRGPWGQES